MSNQWEVALSPTAPAMAEDGSRISAWCFSSAKRTFDVIGASLALIAALPVIAFVAVMVSISSPGPILFRQIRMGKDGKRFALLKFRTMKVSHSQSGPPITRGGDSRITSIGKILRKWKLDELPQLLNVLRGEMSLVGPRPDLPQFCDTLSGKCRLILSLRPGITGWASFQFRDEESLLAAVPEEELLHHYVTTLLPEKARLELHYAQRATCLTDMQLLLRTAVRIFK